MMKKVKLILLMVVVFLSQLPLYGLAETTTAVTGTDAYKAIVQIKTFNLNKANYLQSYGTGSGIIISPSGLVITNYHVISAVDKFDNSNIDLGIIGCLIDQQTQSPICDYPAKIVATNKDLDVAILQLEALNDDSLPGDEISYPYAELSTLDSTNVNDQLTLIGFPGIGDDTVTTSTGIVSGKLDKYNRSWIKTDAQMSFGSSGGAAFDQNGKVVGITTAVHSDLAGSMGYLINVTSLTSWIDSNLSKEPQINKLNERSWEFLLKKANAKQEETFRFNKPSFAITKSEGWDFTLISEDRLLISSDKFDSQESAGIVVDIIRVPLPVAEKDISSYHYLTNDEMLLYGLDIDKSVKINDQPAQLIKFGYLDKKSDYFLYFSAGNFLVRVSYAYGSNDEAKAEVDQIINTIKIDRKNSNFGTLKEYINSTAGFTVKQNNNYYFSYTNDKAKPLLIRYRPNPKLVITTSLEKLSDKNISNQKMLDKEKEMLEAISPMLDLVGMQMKIDKTNINFQPQRNSPKFVKIQASFKKKSKKTSLMDITSYKLKKGDYAIEFSLNDMGGDLKARNKAIVDFEKFLSQAKF